MTQQLSLLEIKPEDSLKSPHIKSKEERTKSRTTQPQTTPHINKTSRTRWTDEEWEDEYWKNTKEHPKDLIKRALEREDDRTAVLLDHILNGYHADNRKRSRRKTEDDLIEEGNWYHLFQLLKAMRVRE